MCTDIEQRWTCEVVAIAAVYMYTLDSGKGSKERCDAKLVDVRRGTGSPLRIVWAARLDQRRWSCRSLAACSTTLGRHSSLVSVVWLGPTQTEMRLLFASVQ